MTLIECIEAASARLTRAGVAFGHGTANAFDEAAWLVLWALALPLDSLDEHAETSVSDADLARIEALIERRITSRQPTAYLTGEAWLQGIPFTVDARAIIPRSLIAECLAEGTIDVWLGANTRRVLDLCTGNGSLAVLAAMCWPEISVVAADLSAEALAVAQLNVERHELTARIRLAQGDGFEAVADVLAPAFDLILCNPPYVNAEAMAALPPEYLAEPALALSGNASGGCDGMDFIRPLLAQAPHYLADGGVLVLEIGHERGHFEAAFPRLDVVWLPTSAGDDQVMLVTREALQALV